MRFWPDCAPIAAVLWSLYRGWQARRRLRITEADELMAAHGDRAYGVARELMRMARAKGDRSAETHFAKTAVEIARRSG